LTRKLLALFCKDWDLVACNRLAATGRYRFFHEGFDLFSFPSNAQLMTFDLWRFVERMARKYEGRVDGVVSPDEQFGALAAALVARRMGLPGVDPAAVVRAQNKYSCRQVQQRAVPEATPAFTAFPYSIGRDDPIALPFPFFVKPVKAAFSVLARRVRNREELHRHLDFRPWEAHVIKRLVRPFNDAAARIAPCDVDAHWLIAEEALEGEQINVDGYVFEGRTSIVGIVDELMYPGTNAFLRFQYPSHLPAALKERLSDVVCRLMRALHYDHGFFNVELFVDRKTGKIGIIEVNPRLASQCADLYERVDGVDPFAMVCAMAIGDRKSVV
jgi:biotin carboxylase